MPDEPVVEPVEPITVPAPSPEPAPEPSKSVADADDAEPKAKAPAEPKEPTQTLAGGGEAVTVPVTATFPDDWRDQIAGDDTNAKKKLDRLSDPVALGKAYLEANAKLEGDWIKVPGKRATKEERTAFDAARGVPEKPEEYLDKIVLANNRVLGDDDKPIVEFFAPYMHKAGTTPAQMSAYTDAWLDYQQSAKERLAESDSEYRVSSEVSLKQEMGGDFKGNTTAIATLLKDFGPEFTTLLLEGRADDGHKFGDHPEVVKALSRIALALYPAGSMHAPDGNQSKALSDRLAEISQFQREHEDDYFNTPKGEGMQEERAKLIEMRDKSKSRAAA